MSNNETIGITAEFALCLLFNLSESLERHRIDWNITEQFIESSVMDLFIAADLLLIKHEGKSNGAVDFYGEKNGIEKTISLKTLKKKDGKICPAQSQLTYNSFHTNHLECPVPEGNLTNPTPAERLIHNRIRWKYIKDTIGLYLNKMQENMFCCDYTLLISNCTQKPYAELLMNSYIDFTNINISYAHEDYQEKKREGRDNTEFSTNVFGDLNGERVKIGEFQFHFKKQNGGGRNVVKFRFYKSFFM